MAEILLQAPSNGDFEPQTRATSPYKTFHDFDLAKAEGYKQQYGDLYFLRLAKLKPSVEKIAQAAWAEFEVGGEKARQFERVLDVRQGELCWIVGTVYMEMPLKPSILDDISKEQSFSAPGHGKKKAKYTSGDDQDQVMLEDESGRLRLIGARLESELLVTGCIIGVLGTEQASGDFEVIDIKLPDLASQPERWAFDKGAGQSQTGAKVAVVSGLDIRGDSHNPLANDLLVEWLLGEAAAPQSATSASQITRLIIAGNSLANVSDSESEEEEEAPDNDKDDGNEDGNDDNDDDVRIPEPKQPSATKKYGYDASAYNPLPAKHLDALLSTLAPSLPITFVPGETDPVNASIPQQPLHPALTPLTRVWSRPPALEVKSQPVGSKPTDAGAYPFHSATNPALLSLSGQLVLATGGQTIDDIARYLSNGRYGSPMDLVEATLRWRNVAPTAPDTLWCYPYQTGDPFVMRDGMCPHLYIVGNQERFETRLVSGDGEDDESSQVVRCVCVPRFSKTGEVVLVDVDTLEVELLRFSTEIEA